MWRQLPTGNTLYLQRNQSLGAHLNKASARQWTFLMFGCLQEGKVLRNLPFTIQGNSFLGGPDKRKKTAKVGKSPLFAEVSCLTNSIAWNCGSVCSVLEARGFGVILA